MPSKYITGLAFIASLLAFGAKAQEKGVGVPLTKQIEAKYNNAPIEKVYLSLDKPYYAAGDTLWFKAFVLNPENKQEKVSGKLYVELYNDSSRLTDQRVILLNNGLGYGDFALDPKLPNGSYTLRAYTNWQQNFGDDYFFQKQFYIGNAGSNTWLIDASQAITVQNTKRILALKLKLSNLKNEAAGFKDVDLALISGNRKLLTTSLQTTSGGFIDTKLTLPDNQNLYSLVITDKRNKNQPAILPINADTAQADLQFMPEGGYLVNGISGKVAFKAIGTNGLGKYLAGKIVNSSNETVASFNATHNGMGSFMLFPQTGQQYTAVYSLKGKELRQPLNIIKGEGTALKIEQFSNPDSILVAVKATPAARNNDYQLIVQAAEKIIVAFKVNLANGFFNLKIPKSTFPDGVIHFTLFSPQQQPLNERAAIINLQKKINIKVAASKKAYEPRDSVALEISATDEEGAPVRGAFALAVTDNNQVRLSPDEGNIASYFLLQGDVKGNIENAGWYFKDTSLPTLQALDNLLLTQAWIGYRWTELNSMPKFRSEKGNDVYGQLNHLFQRSAGNINMNLLSLGRGIFMADTLSDTDGGFVFKNLPVVDTPQYVIKIKNKKGKDSGATIKVDEFKPAAAPTGGSLIFPWYVNASDTLLKYNKIVQKREEQSEKIRMQAGERSIKAVEITGVRQEILNDLGWDAHLDIEITEAELKTKPRKNLRDLLQEKYTGFRVSNYWDTCGYSSKGHENEEFVISGSLIQKIRIDKIDMRDYAGPEPLFKDPVFKQSHMYLAVREIFEYINAEDVTNVSIYKGCSAWYLDITTRSGNGPWVRRAKGVYVYRPLPVYLGKDFYSPKYAADKTGVPDMRSTVFWNANVVTDEHGMAVLSFYAADLPGSYTVKVEGTDLQGRFGYKTDILQVKQEISSK